MLAVRIRLLAAFFVAISSQSSGAAIDHRIFSHEVCVERTEEFVATVKNRYMVAASVGTDTCDEPITWTIVSNNTPDVLLRFTYPIREFGTLDSGGEWRNKSTIRVTGNTTAVLRLERRCKANHIDIDSLDSIVAAKIVFRKIKNRGNGQLVITQRGKYKRDADEEDLRRSTIQYFAKHCALGQKFQDGDSISVSAAVPIESPLILIDGSAEYNLANDRLFTARSPNPRASNSVSTENFGPLQEPQVSEAVVFSKSHAAHRIDMQSELAPEPGDKVEIFLSPPIPVGIQVWMPEMLTHEERSTRIKFLKDEIALSNCSFRKHRVGVQLRWSVCNNEQSAECPPSDAMAMIAKARAGEDELRTLKSSRWYAPDAINVYDLSGPIGQALNPSGIDQAFEPAERILYLSANEHELILAHELAHVFGLSGDKADTTGRQEFGWNNLMNLKWPGIDLTLGQVFRMNFHTKSALADLAGRISTDGVRRHCSPSDGPSMQCPAMTMDVASADHPRMLAAGLEPKHEVGRVERSARDSSTTDICPNCALDDFVKMLERLPLATRTEAAYTILRGFSDLGSEVEWQNYIASIRNECRIEGSSDLSEVSPKVSLLRQGEAHVGTDALFSNARLRNLYASEFANRLATKLEENAKTGRTPALMDLIGELDSIIEKLPENVRMTLGSALQLKH